MVFNASPHPSPLPLGERVSPKGSLFMAFLRPLIKVFPPSVGFFSSRRTGKREATLFSPRPFRFFFPLPKGERARVRGKTGLFILAAVLVVLGGCIPKQVQPLSGVFAGILAEPKEGKAPLTVQFDATRSTDPAGPITDYLWDFGDGSSIASGAQVSHTFHRAGEYLVTLVVVGPSGTGRATVLIRVLNNPPVASFTVWPKDPFTDESVTFDASSSFDPDGDPLTYTWDFGDGAVAQGKIVQHTYKKAGEYLVILTVSDPAGAQGRATALLKVEECPGGRCGRR